MARLVQSQCTKRERERESEREGVLIWVLGVQRIFFFIKYSIRLIFLSLPKLEIGRFDICDVIFYFFSYFLN